MKNSNKAIRSWEKSMAVIFRYFPWQDNGGRYRILAMKIALIQFAPVFGKTRENLEAIERLCRDLTADLVVLPELCTTGYQFRDRQELRSLSEPADGPSLVQLARIADGCGGVVVAGFAERDGSGLFNSAALVSAGGPLGLYRKVHLFADEKTLFDPGDRGFQVFSLSGVEVGMMICFDWIFPESARSLSVAGAQVIAHPANLVLPFCQDAMVTRALENRVFTATANRTGTEARIQGKTLRFSGSSRLVDPGGAVLAEGPPDGEAVCSVTIDPAKALDKRVTPDNHVLDDRRPDQYRV
jgi:predicted amidohydrolase